MGTLKEAKSLLNFEDKPLPETLIRRKDIVNPLDLLPKKFAPGIIEQNEQKDGLKRHWFKIDRKLTTELYEKHREIEAKMNPDTKNDFGRNYKKMVPDKSFDKKFSKKPEM